MFSSYNQVTIYRHTLGNSDHWDPDRAKTHYADALSRGTLCGIRTPRRAANWDFGDYRNAVDCKRCIAKHDRGHAF